jgi:hypothetical protein
MGAEDTKKEGSEVAGDEADGSEEEDEDDEKLMRSVSRSTVTFPLYRASTPTSTWNLFSVI